MPATSVEVIKIYRKSMPVLCQTNTRRATWAKTIQEKPAYSIWAKKSTRAGSLITCLMKSGFSIQKIWNQKWKQSKEGITGRRYQCNCKAAFSRFHWQSEIWRLKKNWPLKLKAKIVWWRSSWSVVRKASLNQLPLWKGIFLLKWVSDRKVSRSRPRCLESSFLPTTCSVSSSTRAALGPSRDLKLMKAHLADQR